MTTERSLDGFNPKPEQPTPLPTISVRKYPISKVEIHNQRVLDHVILGTKKIQRVDAKRKKAEELAKEEEFQRRLEHIKEGKGSEYGALYVALVYAEKGDFSSAQAMRDLIDPERLPVDRYHINPEWNMDELDPEESLE